MSTLQDTCVKTLKLCPSNMNLAGAEVELVSLMSREQRLKEKLDLVKDDFDYIFIDCPPSLGLITLNSFTAADSVLIPVQCEYFALEGLGQLINTINLVKKHLNKSLEIEGAVLTMYDMRTNLSNQVVREVKRYFNDKVFVRDVRIFIGTRIHTYRSAVHDDLVFIHDFLSQVFVGEHTFFGRS